MKKHITPEILVDTLPIVSGDTLLIASNIERIYWEALQANVFFDFQKLIDLLQEKVGGNGTLLFPTYNWGFCRGIPFNYVNTKSMTGSLSQIALERADFIRTKHPIYSFAVWGKDTSILFNMEDKNSFVGNTPFEYLHKKNNSKMVMIDVDTTHSFTFVHYLEEKNKVFYRYLKSFIGDYIDIKCKKTLCEYTMYVRDLNINGVVDFSQLDKILLKNQLMIELPIMSSKIRVLNFKESSKVIEHDIQYNRSQSIVRLD